MTTTSHTACHHPATKAARAACRKARAAHINSLRRQAGELIYSYYHEDGDYEEIIHALMMIFPEVQTAYFETDLGPDELIALASQCKHNL